MVSFDPLDNVKHGSGTRRRNRAIAGDSGRRGGGDLGWVDEVDREEMDLLLECLSRLPCVAVWPSTARAADTGLIALGIFLDAGHRCGLFGIFG